MKLKPCPFCDGEARWCGEGDDSCGNQDCPHIHCDNCGMHFSFEGKYTGETLNELRLITLEAWNRREK